MPEQSPPEVRTARRDGRGPLPGVLAPDGLATGEGGRVPAGTFLNLRLGGSADMMFGGEFEVVDEGEEGQGASSRLSSSSLNAID